MNEYKGYKFLNIESNYDEVAADLDQDASKSSTIGIPDSEITPFSLWVKSELSPTIARVTISKRLTTAPAVIVGQVSSSMRAMLAMVDQSQYEQATRDQSLEINPNHPVVAKLNKIRKHDTETASMLLRELFDNVMLQSGIPYDVQKSSKRSYKLLEMLLDYKLSSSEGDDPQIIIEDVESRN